MIKRIHPMRSALLMKRTVLPAPPRPEISPPSLPLPLYPLPSFSPLSPQLFSSPHPRKEAAGRCAQNQSGRVLLMPRLEGRIDARAQLIAADGCPQSKSRPSRRHPVRAACSRRWCPHAVRQCRYHCPFRGTPPSTLPLVVDDGACLPIEM